MLISEAFSNYLRYHKITGSTVKTIKNYSEIISKFIEYLDDIDLGILNVDCVYDYQEFLFDRGLSNSTISTYIRHIKAFIFYLEHNNYIKPGSIAKRIKLPRALKRTVNLFNSLDIENIINHIKLSPDWLMYRNRLIFALMYDSGLRQSEVCGIIKKDFNFIDGLLLVHGKGGKERIVPIGSFTKKYYKLYVKSCPFHGEYLLYSFTGEQLTANAVKKFMYKLKSQTGLKDLSSHKLRHNFATNYCIDCYKQNGYIDIYKLSALLGHEEIETTKIYLHIANQYIAQSGFISHLDKIL